MYADFQLLKIAKGRDKEPSLTAGSVGSTSRQGDPTAVKRIEQILFTAICLFSDYEGWLGSRVVSMLDSGAEGPGFKSQPRRCRVSLWQIVHTNRVCSPGSKSVATLLRVAGVTSGLAESNGSLSPGL